MEPRLHPSRQHAEPMAPYNTALGAGVGGGAREATSDHVTSWARSRRHSGVWMGRCGAFGDIHHTTWRISRRLTTWVGQAGWDEGDVSAWAKGQTTRR